MTGGPRRRRDEAGHALVLAVGVSAVGLSVGLTVSAAGVAANRASATDRQRTSLVAAAESGVDSVHAQLDAATSGWPCTSPQTLSVAGGSDPSTVTVTLEYFAGSAATTCTGDPTAVVVTSRAVAGRSLSGGATPHRTMVARFALSSAPPVTTLRQAVFGEGGVTASNTLDVYESAPGALDADVYTNTGPYTCYASGTVHGSILTQNDVVLHNLCSSAGPVWTGGRFSADPTATVNGDVWAAATTGTGIAIGNSTRIAGNAFTNGDVSLGNGSVGGSALSTQGKISFGNGAHIDGSAYARLGLTYTTGSFGRVGRDVVASAGSIASGATSIVGETLWSIGGNATASPSGCVTNTVSVGGTTSPARRPVGQSCSLPTSALTPTVAFPATPNNPSGVSSPALPATVPAPPRRPFPTLYTRTDPARAGDPLDAWRSAGWDVHVFSGTGTQPCTDAMAFLKSAKDGADHAAWVAKPLAVVVRGCTSSLYWDANNRQIFDWWTTTWTLYNDLAIIADHGIGNANGMSFASDSSATRKLLWIVPTDSPFTIGAPACTPWTADLTPNNVSTTHVSWFLMTPCAVNAQNSFGSWLQPVSGALYGGTVSVSNAWLTFAPMDVPGLDDGSGAGDPSVVLGYKREIAD